MRNPIFSQIIILIAFFLYGCGGSDSKKEAPSPEEIKITGKACIENVINHDDSLGTIRNHASETNSLSQAITNYTESVDKIDFTQCPKKFTDAFENHKKAWLNLRQMSDKYPDLRGEMHDLFDIIEKTADSSIFKESLKLIWDTWDKVDEIAKKG